MFLGVFKRDILGKGRALSGGRDGRILGAQSRHSCVVFVLTILSAVKYLFKPVLVLLVLLAGGASWFIDNLGVLIDTDMVRNVFETTSAEAGDLLTAGYFRHMLLVAVIPSLLILWVRVRFPSAERVVLWNVGITASCIAIIAGSGALYYKPYSAVIRTKRELAKTLNPVTPLVSIAKVALATGNERNVVVKPLGEDATVTTPVDGLSKLRVAVIVVGETARGANFSLGFYERETNPLLKTGRHLLLQFRQLRHGNRRLPAVHVLQSETFGLHPCWRIRE